MIKLYVLNKKLTDKQIINTFGKNDLLAIRIANKTFGDILSKNLHEFDMQIYDDIKLIPDKKNRVLIITSSVYSSNFKHLNDFLNLISTSYFSVISKNSADTFIFYGFLDDLLNDKSNKFRIKYPNYLLDLNDFDILHNIINSNPDSRHFNNLSYQNDLFHKTSTDKIKLKSEYEFLTNVHKSVKNMYPEVYKFNETANNATYTLKAYPFKDLSYQILSNTLNDADINNIITHLSVYFNNSKVDVPNSYILNDFNSLLLKNESRFNLFKSYKFFERMNDIMTSIYDFSLYQLNEKINNALLNYKHIYTSAIPIFSHGDLCFSNILYDNTNNKIKLIDPKGFDNEGIRSPYYDLAKLSHSINGGYDAIINNLSNISIDNTLNFLLEKKVNNKFFLQVFRKFITTHNFDFKLILLIESSLFLSMCPLHIDNDEKCFKLLMQSYITYQQYLITS